VTLSRPEGGSVRRRRLGRRALRPLLEPTPDSTTDLEGLLGSETDTADDTAGPGTRGGWYFDPRSSQYATPLPTARLDEPVRTDPAPTTRLEGVLENPIDSVTEPIGAAGAPAPAVEPLQDADPTQDAETTQAAETMGGGTTAGGATAPSNRATAPVAAARTAFRRTGRPRRTPFWRLIGRTLAKAWNDRILGLAAEAGFWQLLSLPPLLLAVFGTIGYLGDALGHDVVASIEGSLLDAARHILTPSTVTESVQPTVDDVLRNGRPDVISLGFVLSIWSGSTAMSTYVNTITIAYDERHERNAIRSRLLALRLYLAQVLTGVLLLPALVLGPTLLDRILDQRVDRWARTLVNVVYWPLVAVLSLTILTSLYHLSVPHRRPWRRAVPGSVLALVIWLVGCYGLRYYVSAVFGRAVVYGTLAAPVAVLLFFYITAFAVLLGAEFNATLDLARRERTDATTRVR